MTHKSEHDYINHVTRTLEKSALYQNDLTYAYVIKSVHRIVIISTDFFELLQISQIFLKKNLEQIQNQIRYEYSRIEIFRNVQKNFHENVYISTFFF